MVNFNRNNNDVTDEICSNAYDLIRNREHYYKRLQHNSEIRDCPDALSFVSCVIVGMCRQLWGYEGSTDRDEELAQAVYDVVTGCDALWRLYKQQNWDCAGFETPEHLASSVAIVQIADAWGTA